MSRRKVKNLFVFSHINVANYNWDFVVIWFTIFYIIYRQKKINSTNIYTVILTIITSTNLVISINIFSFDLIDSSKGCKSTLTLTSFEPKSSNN